MVDALIGMTIDVSSFMATSAKQRDDAPRGGTGSQVLPVSVDLPDDFDGVPEDGMQYLFTVRQEAKKQSLISRVANPYQVIEDVVDETPAPRKRQVARPTEEWRSKFVTQFQQLRQRLAAAPSISSFPPTTHNTLPLPQDESAWHLFIHGRKIKSTAPTTGPALNSVHRIPTATAPATVSEDVQMTPIESLESAKSALLASLELDSPSAPTPTFEPPASTVEPTYDPSHPPHYPSPSLLLSIPTPYIPRLLTHFETWFLSRQEDYELIRNYVPSTIFAPHSLRRKPTSSSSITTGPTPRPTRTLPRPPLMTAHELHWLLSLLTRLDSLLDGEDISSLRSLVRTIRALMFVSEEACAEREEARKGPRGMEEKRLDEDEAERRAMGWMITAAVCGVWRQTDLWDED